MEPSEATAAQAAVLSSETPQYRLLPPSWPCPLASPQAQAPARRCAPHTKGSDSLKLLAGPSPSATCFLSGKMLDVGVGACGVGVLRGALEPLETPRQSTWQKRCFREAEASGLL